MRVTEFVRTFPLAMDSTLTEEDLFYFITAPQNLFLEFDQGLTVFENLVPMRDAKMHFVFWDRKVAEREGMLREVIAYAFEAFKLVRLSAHVPERNRVMWRMFEKLGFQSEGRVRRAFLATNNTFHDILLFGLLREEMS